MLGLSFVSSIKERNDVAGIPNQNKIRFPGQPTSSIISKDPYLIIEVFSDSLLLQ